MLTTLQNRLKSTGKWLPVALLPLLPLAAQAQTLNYTPTGATNIVTSFTDVSITGTAITTANTDDANSAAQPIGFTFNYNGAAFTQFILNTNGFIKLGNAAPSSAALYYQAETTFGGDALGSAIATDINIIAPFNVNLESGTAAGGAQYQVATTGVAGSRVCTIQWTNVRDKAITSSPQYDSFTFQVRLFEGSNNIDFVYGPTVAGVTGADIFRLGAAGIKGAGPASGQIVLANKTTSGAAWSTTAFIGTPYSGSALNYRRASPPDLGRTFHFTPAVLLNNDAAVTAIYTLGKVSSAFGSPVSVQAVVTNAGSSAQTNLPVTLTVAGATTYSNTQTVATLASGASTTVTFSYPVTGTTGTNTLTVAVPNTDDLATNNTKTATQAITAGSITYIDPAGTLNAAGVGIGAAGGILASRYTLTQAGTISSVTPTFVGAGAGPTTYQVQLYDATGTGGTPGALLYTSPTQTRPTVTGSPVISVPNVPIAAGNFFVAIKELDLNLGLGYQVEDPLRTNTFYFQVPPATTWNSVNTTALRTRLALEVNVVAPPACAPVQNLTATAITATSASLTFTGTAGVTYTITYQGAGGAVQTVTPAPTAGPVALTGLTPATVYTVSVTTNCTGGLTSTPATTTFTTLVAPPAFAPLPYSQNFETTWLNVGSTHDAPAANWRSTPVTGDNSFRRDEDGASGGWRFLGDDTDPTLHVYDIRFSSGAHSARFHSYGTAAGLQGKLDMYVDMSVPNTKVLSFDYINPTGTDKLEVFVSTDGGTTFSTTPVLTATTNAAFTAKTVTINSTSATTVIRFQATSDFGNDDLGFDNVQLRVLTATQNAALAATVGLYPNPAHQSFQLSVPAGSLRAASATLINALGQVVQSRQLNLPAAGGVETFNVSSLAAGVYSLQLKSGNDLVVKRVVVE